MNKEKKQKGPYSLEYIRSLITQKRYRIKNDALSDARKDFGWNASLMLQAIKALKKTDYNGSKPSRCKNNVLIDSYKTIFKSRQIYTHFYIESDLLVINSFKQRG